MADSTFRVGGLASGLDTNSIVDKLVALESRPIETNTKRQAAISVQISAIGDLIGKIKALASQASTLASGVAASSVATTPSGVSATAGSGALPGTYSISVTTVASAAKARSFGFDSTNDTVAGGNLNLNVKGVAYNIAITANSDLGSVVRQINSAGAPVQAAVISDGTKFYVSLTNRETGKPIGSGADGGLSITGDTTGLTMAVTQNATNAVLTVDGLPVESQSNQITSAIPGVTLTVKAEQPVAADLVINRDSSKTGDNLQAFVDAYNAIMKSISGPLRPSPDGGPSGGRQLDGTTAIELQQRMYKLLSTKVVETGTVRTLADLGVKLQKDGTVLLDRTVLNNVVGKDSASVDAIFSTASTGLKAQAEALSTLYTDTLDGRLIHRRTSLEKTVKDLQVSNDKLSRHVESFKLDLIRRFTQMESLMANYNSIGNFLSSSPVFNPDKGSK